MRLRMVMSLVVLALVAMGPVVAKAAIVQSAADSKDQITGEWEALCEIGGGSATLTLNFKLDGDKVTGTAESAHTGPGTVKKGSWSNNKLNFTVEFAAHESIEVAGSLKDGQLSGDFHTEGMVGQWKAARKTAPAVSSATLANSAATTGDQVSGDWEATLEAQGNKAPVTLKLKLDGDKITGTSESAHLGPGTVSKGSWTNNRLSFTLDVSFGPIVITGTLQDGKLAGDFDAAGKMHGKWEAKKK
jgi:hypothetical protein